MTCRLVQLFPLYSCSFESSLWLADKSQKTSSAAICRTQCYSAPVAESHLQFVIRVGVSFFFLSDSDLMVVKTHMTCVSKQVIPSFVVAVRHGITPPFPCSPDHIHHLQTSDEFCCQFIILYTACVWSAPWPCCHIIIHSCISAEKSSHTTTHPSLPPIGRRAPVRFRLSGCHASRNDSCVMDAPLASCDVASVCACRRLVATHMDVVVARKVAVDAHLGAPVVACSCWTVGPTMFSRARRGAVSGCK
jgi:hypothetical protein